MVGNKTQLAAPRRSPDPGVSSQVEVERLGEEKAAGEESQEFPVPKDQHLGTIDGVPWGLWVFVCKISSRTEGPLQSLAAVSLEDPVEGLLFLA